VKTLLSANFWQLWFLKQPGPVLTVVDLTHWSIGSICCKFQKYPWSCSDT